MSEGTTWTRVTVRLTDEDLERLDREKDRDQRNRSQQLRVMVREYWRLVDEREVSA